MARQQASVSNPGEDPIKDMEIKIKELQLEQKKRELEWELEDRQAERQEELSEFTEEMAEDPQNAVITALLSSLMAGKNIQPVLSPGQNQPLNQPFNAVVSQDSLGSMQQAVIMPNEAGLQELNEQEINQILDGIPKQYLKMAQKYEDSLILKMLKGNYPGYTEKTYLLALACLKKRRI